MSLFGAKREWNPATHPDPFEYLKSVVNSELWNLSVSVDNQRHDRLGEDDSVGPDNPEALAIIAEEQAEIRARRDRGYSLLVDHLADDKDLLRLHDLMIQQEIQTPRALAEKLGISVPAVNNLKKRFWRACHRVLELLEAEVPTNV